MRDPNRLDDFYEQLKIIHKLNFPDWRFSQLFNNLQSWSGSDLFYVEEDKRIDLIKKYAAGINWKEAREKTDGEIQT